MWSITVRNCRAMDAFSTSCGEHTVRHINAESLHCIPETNMILYVNCNFKKTKNMQYLDSVIKSQVKIL